MKAIETVFTASPESGRIVAMLRFNGMLLVATENKVVYYKTDKPPVLGFDEWARENGYTLEVEEWSGRFISDYFKVLSEAHTKYLEWRLDNAHL